MYKLVDLFSGAGGLTCGFVRTGLFEPIFAVEKDKHSANTYMANFGCHMDNRDIVQVLKSEPIEKLRADIVIGGPPCQGFSNLGPNNKNDARRTMWRPFMDFVIKCNCSMFLMENVPNLLSSEEGNEIINAAKNAGFFVSSKVLLASNFGVPQNRKRAFIVGTKHNPMFLSECNGEYETVRGAFKDIPKDPNVFDFKPNGPVPTNQLHIKRNPTPLSLKRYALIPPGGNRFDLQRIAPELTPECWKKKSKGGTDLYGRIHWDEPARCTIRTEFYKPEKGRFLHPQEDRPITHWEAARLQTFPDDFLWCGTKISIANQIGNAVPPRLAQAIALEIAENLKTPLTQHDKQPNQMSFEFDC